MSNESHKKYDDSVKIKNFKQNSLEEITKNLSDLKQTILTLFKENPTKLYTARMMFDIIRERTPKYYVDTLWGLEKKGYLVRPQRGYYQWNEKH